MNIVRAVSRNDEAAALLISMGKIEGVVHFNKFGYTDTIGATFETIWDGVGVYPRIATATTAIVGGTETAGTTINIQGLNENWELDDETVAVGSTSTKKFKRVFRAKLVDHPDGVNANDITITVDGAIRAKILAGNGQTLMAVFTVPKGYTGYMLKFQGSVEKQKEVTFSILTHYNGSDVCTTKGHFGSFGTPVTYDYPIPVKYTEKTDIEVRAKAGATTGVGALFDILLIKDPV